LISSQNIFHRKNAGASCSGQNFNFMTGYTRKCMDKDIDISHKCAQLRQYTKTVNH